MGPIFWLTPNFRVLAKFVKHGPIFEEQSLTLVYRRGWLPPPLRIIFRPAKTLNFTIKWVQLIVGSSFPVKEETHTYPLVPKSQESEA